MPLVSALAAVAARGYGWLQGPRSAFELIETQTVGAGGAASVTFSSIPQTYKHLQIRGVALSAGTYSADMQFTFNSDTAANYSHHQLSGDGSTATSYNAANASYMAMAMTPNATYPVGFVMDVLDYANTTKYKTARSLFGIDRNGSGYAILSSGSWRNTNAVTSLKIVPVGGSLNQYSTFSLYGVK